MKKTSTATASKPSNKDSISVSVKPQDLVKIGQAAKLLGISIDTLRRWEKKGWIKTVKTPGGTRLYEAGSLKKFNPNLFKRQPLVKANSVPPQIKQNIEAVKAETQPQIDTPLSSVTTETPLVNSYRKAPIQDETPDNNFKNLLSNQKKLAEEFAVSVEIAKTKSVWEDEDAQSFSQYVKEQLGVVADRFHAKQVGALALFILIFTSFITAGILLGYTVKPYQTKSFVASSSLFSPFNKLAVGIMSSINPKQVESLGLIEKTVLLHTVKMTEHLHFPCQFRY